MQPCAECLNAWMLCGDVCGSKLFWQASYGRPTWMSGSRKGARDPWTASGNSQGMSRGASEILGDCQITRPDDCVFMCLLFGWQLQSYYFVQSFCFAMKVAGFVHNWTRKKVRTVC